ncbi:helix-turn-helix domain-containing protein [Rhodoblastus sp.]|uniref:helix-turn-helix domain-containing protein n=1 Tax=Rhodoblastus sp. TaxID=1962975 RepID=UPI003F9653A1
MKPGFDVQIPDWALSELKAPQQAISRPAGSTRKRQGLVGDVAQDVDLTRRAPLVTVQQAAVLLNVSPRTIRRLIAWGELAAVRIGGSVRIRPAELERLALDSADN